MCVCALVYVCHPRHVVRSLSGPTNKSNLCFIISFAVVCAPSPGQTNNNNCQRPATTWTTYSESTLTHRDCELAISSSRPPLGVFCKCQNIILTHLWGHKTNLVLFELISPPVHAAANKEPSDRVWGWLWRVAATNEIAVFRSILLGMRWILYPSYILTRFKNRSTGHVNQNKKFIMQRVPAFLKEYKAFPKLISR